MGDRDHGVKNIYGLWYAGHEKPWMHDPAEAVRFTFAEAQRQADHYNGSLILGNPYYAALIPQPEKGANV